MIEIRNLCKSYGKKVIYKGLNLKVPEETITCIIGPSGCGKTTLLRILAGLEKADDGEILGIAHKRKAFVFQEDRLMPWLSVKENIEYAKINGLKYYGLSDHGINMPGGPHIFYFKI